MGQRLMLDIHIRQRISDYVSDRISLRDFQHWLVSSTWGIDPATDPAASDLTYKVELALAEYTSGHMTEAELRRELDALTRTYSVRLSLGTAAGYSVTTSAGASTRRFQSYGTQLVEEYA